MLPFMVGVLSSTEAVAETTVSVVPGLLYGSAPEAIVDDLIPSVELGGGQAFLELDFAGRPVSKTGVKAGSSGLVGVSRILKSQDDPNCEEFWGTDKWRHAGVWFAGSLGIYFFFKTAFKASKLVSYLLSAAVMSVIGLAREISDANSDKNCFSEQDLFANTTGILAAGVVIAIF